MIDMEVWEGTRRQQRVEQRVASILKTTTLCVAVALLVVCVPWPLTHLGSAAVTAPAGALTAPVRSGNANGKHVCVRAS
jgi:hypothetical protein